MPEPFADISGLLYPRSIAVIGASDRTGNVGGDTVDRLLRFRFPGPIWAVNANGGTVRGIDCHRSVADLPEPPECAVIAVPAAAVLDAVRACAGRGTRNGIAYAGGMSESGPEGQALERQVVAFCRESGFRLVGPNCLGIINVATPVMATFSTVLHEVASLRPGPISMVTQSGGIGTAALAAVQQAGFGFRHLISGGNEAVLTFADYLYALAIDDGTRIIAAYLEGAGDGPRLLAALQEAQARGKPVVMIKAGATAASAQAARAHTGALVGEDRVFDAVLRESGVLRVGSVEEMVDVCLVLAGMPEQRPMHGNGLGIVTFGGGNGVLAADQCAQVGLTTPPLDAARVRDLRPLLLSVASAANPMDLTPSMALRPDALARLPAAMDVLAGQDDLDAVALLVGGLAVRAKEISDIFIDFTRRCAKPVCVAWPAPPAGVIARFAEHGVAAFDDPARALRVLGRLAQMQSAPAGARPGALRFDWEAHVPAGATLLTEDRCHTLLRAAWMPVAEGALAADAASAIAVARRIGFPVVMKGIAAAVTHRAAAGLLAVDLRTEDEIAAAFRRLARRAEAIGVALDGVYVQKLAPPGTELLVSAFNDAMFGPMISVGAGGGLTELLDDVVTARAPVDAAAATAMLRRLRLYRHARDADGLLDPAAPAEFISRLSRLAAGARWPRFTLEVNPIRWNRAGAVAVDGLLLIETTG